FPLKPDMTGVDPVGRVPKKNAGDAGVFCSAAASGWSVLRHAAVHVLRPGVDAAGDVEHVAKTQCAKLFGGLQAAATAVAHESQRGVLGQGFEPGAVVA